METPFNSDWFIKTWLKHFKNSVAPIKFEFIDGVQFYKNNKLPVYINIGKNLTKGFNYTIDPDKIKYSNRVLLIYDIPTYFKIPLFKESKNLKSKHIKQYNGYLTSVDKYNNIDDFLKSNYSSSDRKLFRRRQNRLNKSFNISSKMYFGSIDPDIYNLLFDQLKELLIKRFQEKQTDYHILSKWDYIKELTYPMIMSKDAALYVIYSDSEPIAMQLCFHHNKKLIGAIPVYDTDYAKYGLGNILTFKVIEWCINNDMDVFDSSKGDYGIKKHISDIVYHFEFHVLFNPRSIISTLLAYRIIYFYQIKQYLRKRNIHTLYHSLKFMLGGFMGKNKAQRINYEFINEEFDIAQEKDISPIDYKQNGFSFLRKIVFDYLYSNPEKNEDVKIYRKKDSNIYYIIGKLKQQKVMVMPYLD